MDHSAESGTLSTHTTAGGPVLEHELSTSSPRCLSESGGNILLQLLEFKTHLLEAVEELHILRDAEARFEDQISKLVLEKQELEWEKESLQHQTETLAKQHTESLTNVKKQFQAKIRNIEEEKGTYQVSAELKDKEINNLKEELKSLQLLKYNLSKKSSELEQKLALQSRSKDSHLNQLGEVEKRFSALSRQCAIVKQAHEKLEQDVDEAMKMNKKLTSANGKQEATILSLKKELEEVSRKLIKAKMSSVRHDKAHGPTGREQCIQQLQHKLNMETEMNRKLAEENITLRAEKQEVMRSLQHAQQLLLSQTQTVSRVELEMQNQRGLYQGLKQEHEVMREKSKALEDKVAQLMESYAASKTSWDKERAMFLDRIKSEQEDLQAVTEAYDELQQKHTKLSSQTQHIYKLEMTGSSQSVSTQVFPSLAEEIREEETLNEPIFSLEHSASIQTKTSDCLDDTGAVTVLVDYEATGGQDTPNHHRQSQFKQPPNLPNMFTCSLNNNNLFSVCSLSGTTVSASSTLNKYTNNSDTGESDHDVVSDLIHSTSSVSDNGLLISKGSCVTDTSTVSSPANDGSGDLLRKEKRDEGNGGMSGENDVTQGKNNKKEEINGEQQWNGEEVQGDDVKEGGSAGGKRGTLMAHTADRADRREDSQRSTEDTGDTKQPETETKDRAEGEGTDGAEERAKKGLRTPETPETQIMVETTTDITTGESNAQRVIDFMDTEPPLAACEPSDCLSQTVSERDADSTHVKKGCEIKSEVHTLCSDEHQRVSHGPNSIIQEIQHLSHEEAQTFAESLTQTPLQVHQGFKKTTEEEPSNKLAVSVLTEVSELLNQSSICSSQTDAAPLATPLDGIVSTQDRETNTTQTQRSYPPDTASNMEQTDEECDLTHVREDCVLLRTMVTLQSQEMSEQESGQLRSLVTDVQDTAEKSNVMGACVDITVDNVDSVSAVETDSCQEPMKSEDAEDAMTTKSETDFKLSIHQSHEDDASPETGSAKCCEQCPTKELLLDDTNELSLPRNMTYRSSFDWASVQRKTVSSSTKSDVSALHQFVQGSHMSEQNTSDPGGVPGHSPSTIPMFLKNKHRKVPLVITKASDLLNASSVSGTAASSRRHHQGEWKAVGETCRETAAADAESRASLSISSYPVSTSSIAVSRLSWQTTPGCSRAPLSSAGLSSESGDWEPSCSQEREDQQSSFRAQISKIEQFLNTERLRLPKRRRTDN